MPQETTTTTLAIIAALGLLSVIAIESISIAQQQAYAAGCENGFPNSFFAFNASQGRCFGH